MASAQPEVSMPASRKSTNCAVLIASAIALICAGCTVGRYHIKPAIGRCDVEPQYRSASFQDIGAPYTPRLVKIDVEYRMWGRNWKTLSRQIEPEIVSGLTSNRVFVAADKLNEADAGHLLVVVKQDLTALKFVEILAKSTVAGITYTLVPTSVNVYYNMEVTYTPLGGEAVSWKGTSPIHKTVGVLAASVHNENSVANIDALPVLTEGMAANFAQDFAKHEASVHHANASITPPDEAGLANRINRLPPVQVTRGGVLPYTIQPATATQPTPTFVR
jgi:hypothetical protein